MVKTKKKAKKGFSKIFKGKVKPKKKKPVRYVVKMKKAGVKKPAKGAVRKPSVKKSSKTKEKEFVVGFEEIIVKCPSCGRQFRIVKSSGFSMEGMLCQRCAAGGGEGLGGDEF